MTPPALMEPYLERFLLGEKKQWSEIVLEASREMALSALSLPGELQRFMDRALRGEIEVGFKNLDDNARMLYYGGEQILGVLVGDAGGHRGGAGGGVRRARPDHRDRRGRRGGRPIRAAPDSGLVRRPT